MNIPLVPPEDPSTVDIGQLNNSLALLLRLAQVRMYDQFFVAFSGTDVRPGEMTVLWTIDLNPGIKQGVLGRVLSIKPAHATKLIQRLVDAGFIERRVPPEDRRSVRLSLTAEGRGHLERHRETFQNLYAAADIGLTEAEHRALLKLLRKLAFDGAQACP